MPVGREVVGNHFFLGSHTVDSFFQTGESRALSDPINPPGGGNFMFALLSMILLEFACRVCARDKTGVALQELTKILQKRERPYFTPIPGTCNTTSEFTLPGTNPQSHLLGMMFDLIRNGKAHQYQSAIAILADGEVDIDITGAASDRSLTRPGRRHSRRHLRYKLSPSGDLSLYIRTDQLFLDIKSSIEESGIMASASAVSDIVRPRALRSTRVLHRGPH